jgi:hypothetical protein
MGVWEIIAPLIEPLNDVRAWSIFQWLHDGAMPLVPKKALFRWIDEDVPKRAKWVARFVPKDLFSEEPDASICRQLLIRYGERKDLRTQFLDNFLSEGVVGPRSEHYIELKQRVLSSRSREVEPNRRLWLDEYIASLEREIETAKMLEEREFV